jgi:hypothetical protein
MTEKFIIKSKSRKMENINLGLIILAILLIISFIVKKNLFKKASLAILGSLGLLITASFLINGGILFYLCIILSSFLGALFLRWTEVRV